MTENETIDFSRLPRFADATKRAEEDERIARRLCHLDGNNPDSEITFDIPLYVQAPTGKAMVKPTRFAPLWWAYREKARILIAESKLLAAQYVQELQATE